MQACEELQNLQNDLNDIVKLSRVPMDKHYQIAPGAEISLYIKEIEDSDHYEIAVGSASGIIKARVEGHRRVPAIMVGLTSQKVTEFLVDKYLEPCSTMAHGGADEILHLHKCVKDFRTAPVIPFNSWIQANEREYEIFSIKKADNRWSVALTTNYIYGEFVKTIAEVESETLIPQQCHSLIERMLGEWFRPESVKAVKVVLADFERSQP
ncbi:MAG TPA: hypothetical protein PKD05_02245 [Candidatus Melainabacteria bacterium]|nr:hypothetical protein [Candidatus Melainabacteria bacterium]